MAFDLTAYLERVRLKAAPEPDLEGLRTVQRAHRLAIPFENFDIPLGRGIDLSPDATFAKLVTARRGGYCFEQNGLFLRALTDLGFEARPLLARVWLGQTDTPPRTHLLLLLRIDGGWWIADAGFGGGFCPPMPLAEGVVDDHRLTHDTRHGWLLERQGGDGWMPQYSFTLDEVWPADIAQANHFTATVPGGRFTSNIVAGIVLPHGTATILNRAYNRTSAQGEEHSEITSARMLRMRLSLMFGIDLTAEDADTLWAASA